MDPQPPTTPAEPHTTTTPAETTPPKVVRFFTKEERSILRAVAQSNGWEWVERYADLILDQARAFGDL